MSELAIGRGTLREVGRRMRDVGLRGRAFVVSDDKVFPRHGEATVYQGNKVALVGGSVLLTPKTAEMALALLVNRKPAPGFLLRRRVAVPPHKGPTFAVGSRPSVGSMYYLILDG